jgi:hypothetical protein
MVRNLGIGVAKLKVNSMALVRERTVPTELLGEVSASFFG